MRVNKNAFARECVNILVTGIWIEKKALWIRTPFESDDLHSPSHTKKPQKFNMLFKYLRCDNLWKVYVTAHSAAKGKQFSQWWMVPFSWRTKEMILFQKCFTPQGQNLHKPPSFLQNWKQCDVCCGDTFQTNRATSHIAWCFQFVRPRIKRGKKILWRCGCSIPCLCSRRNVDIWCFHVKPSAADAADLCVLCLSETHAAIFSYFRLSRQFQKISLVRLLCSCRDGSTFPYFFSKFLGRSHWFWPSRVLTITHRQTTWTGWCDAVENPFSRFPHTPHCDAFSITRYAPSHWPASTQGTVYDPFSENAFLVAFRRWGGVMSSLNTSPLDTTSFHLQTERLSAGASCSIGKRKKKWFSLGLTDIRI